MHTYAIFAIFALTAATSVSAANSEHTARSWWSGAEEEKPKPTVARKLGKAVEYGLVVAGAAVSIGMAVHMYKNRKNQDGAATSTRRSLEDEEELYARELYNEVYARAFEEYYARAMEDEGLFVREFVEDALEAREYDDAHWARGDFEELLTRANEAVDELD